MKYPIGWRQAKDIKFKVNNKILIDNATDLSADSLSVEVNIRENKINDAVMIANDDAGKTYVTNLEIGDLVTINFAYVDDTDNWDWAKIFYGIVVDKEPTVDIYGGAVCRVQLYAYPAIALNRMRARGLFSSDPANLDTLREILVTGNAATLAALNDFPYTEYFTEDCVIQDIEGDNPLSDWNRFGTNTYMNLEDTGAKVGSHCVLIRGPNIEDTVHHSNYDFSSYTAEHGFPMFIDSSSNPQYDPVAEEWDGIPYLVFFMKRTAEHHDIELQLKVTDTDYVRLQLTDQNHGTGNMNLNLVPNDGEWHYFVVPVGSRWAEKPITVDGNAVVTDTMTDNSAIWGIDLRDLFGWEFSHTNGQGETQIWEGITSINFLVTLKSLLAGTTDFYIDSLKFVGLGYPEGIITDYVNKIFSLEDSSYNIDTTYIVDDGQEVPFCKFIYEPVTKCLKDITDLITGYNWNKNRGVGKHWTMIDNYLCISNVNDHTRKGPHKLLLSDVTNIFRFVMVSLTDGAGITVGQTISISDDNNSETKVITQIDVLSDRTQLIFETNLVHSYYTTDNAYAAVGLDQIWKLATKYTREKPLVVSEDIIKKTFKHMEPEANFVIVNGTYVNPPNNDWLQMAITNIVGHPFCQQGYSHVGASTYMGDWFFYSCIYQGGPPAGNIWGNTPWEVTHNCIKGPLSLKGSVNSALTGPTTHSFAMLILGSEVDLNLIKDPVLTFWVNSAHLDKFEVRVFTNTFRATASNSTPYVYGADPSSMIPSANEGDGDFFWREVKNVAITGETGWIRIDLPLGPNATGWNINNQATWSKTIKVIVFKLVGGGGVGSVSGWAYIDNLNINGQVIRVAKSSDAITSQGGVKAKLINEALATGYTQSPEVKDPLDYIAINDCIRSSMSPVTGQITIPFDPDLLGGQQIWLSSPWFGVEPKCFRILYITLTHKPEEGALSILTLTDDLVNSYPYDPTDLAAMAMKAVNPDFQSRDYIRLKVGSMLWNTLISKIVDIDD